MPGEALQKVRGLVLVKKPALVKKKPCAVEEIGTWGGPLPNWLEPRDYQLEAVEKIMAMYARGVEVVMLDAPTGTGKTAIAELVRRRLQVRGLYVCTTKSLQDQVDRDFDYARVLKGVGNYIPPAAPRTDGRNGTLDGALRISCQDCDRGPREWPLEEQTCTWCPEVGRCPYVVAKQEAHAAPMTVLNTALLLAEGNGRGEWSGREFIIADEADTLEDQLLGYVELRLGVGIVRELGLEVPKKGSHMTTIRTWLREEVRPAVKQAAEGVKGGVEGRRKAKQLARLDEGIARVLRREDGWVRENGEEAEENTRATDALVLKPVRVDDVAGRYLWRHGARWLCMSGTTVSADMQAQVLGLEGVEGSTEDNDRARSWDVVEVPMQFARENRKVVYVPAGSMTRKGQEAGGKAKVLRAIERVLEKHPDGNVLIHTFNYKLAQEVTQHIGRLGLGREVLTYQSASGRDRALAIFKSAASGNGAVLVAASMDRGIDLPGDLCRVQIIAKMPMASLGSRVVSERLHQRDGDAWYLMNNIRTLMQQCGRAVRGVDDWAVTYIVDQHFGKVLGDGKKMGMFPKWWLDGLETAKLREYV